MKKVIKMDGLRLACFVFVYIVVVCPINKVVSHVQAKSAGSHYAPYRETESFHTPVPCEVCPRQGECVPRVRCPAHLRPGSFNPECHLGSSQDIGICCFTGTRHAAEFEIKGRQSSSINAEDVKTAHNLSYSRLDAMLRNAEKLLEHSRNTVVETGSPDFGLHLSSLSTDDQEAKLCRGGLLNLLAAQELRRRQAIPHQDMLLGLTDHTDGPYCSLLPACPDPTRYRSITGECTHPLHRSWGAANTVYEMLLPPDYSDGIWSVRSSSASAPLPSPRTVSSVMLPDGDYPSRTHNMMFMQFSQFIAHDVSAAAIFTFANGSAISCCSQSGSILPPEQQHFACLPVIVDPGDIFYGTFGRTCLNFVRAMVAPNDDCTLGYAKPMNSATHYLDLSHLYGKTIKKALELRHRPGLLKTFSDYGRELPPLTDRKECMSDKERGACFESGDNHGNQIISLTVLHTIFTREHNRLSRELSRLNPDWDDDTLYYETRRLLQAIFQHIVYNEWLPLVIGPNLVQQFDLPPSQGYSSSFDPSINPSILTEFSAAAMRFGHSSVDGKIVIPSPRTGEIVEMVSIPEVMFAPGRLRLRPFLDRMVAGLTSQPMQSVDPFLTDGLTRYMFHGGSPYGLDLASINIQRGRDFGVRSYNYYRRLTGLPPFVDFNHFPPSASKRLSSVYTNPEDIDLWVGGLLEEAVDGGIVGPTFANIIAEQFLRIKRGDRYFYEHGPEVNPGAFTPSQLAEIKKITLARIVCDNIDSIELTSMPPNAFLRTDLHQNTPIQCDSTDIPTMDLSRFKVI